MFKQLSYFFIILLFTINSAWADHPGPDLTKYPNGFVEAGTDFSDLTAGYPNWYGGYLKTAVTTCQKNVWGADFDHRFEFNTEDSFLSIHNTHNFNEDWYSFISLGGSGDGFYWPWYQADISITKKWCHNGCFLTTLGYDRYNYRSGAYTNNGFFGLNFYFNCWICEAGFNLYQNYPGAHVGTTQFLTLTRGHVKQHYLTLRYDFGREAYQQVGKNTAVVNFPFQQGSIIWRQWINKNWGFNVRGEYFASSPYNRAGVWLGIFRDF